MGLRRRCARRPGVRRRRSLPRELDVGHHRAAQVRAAQPEPVDVLPPARRRRRRASPTDDVFFSALPAPFGFGLWTSHVTPAVLGCTTVVQERFDADAALRAIERERVTVLGCVSTQFLMMLNSPELDAARPELAAVHVHRRRGGAVRARRALRGRHRRARAAVLRLERDRRAEPHHDATTTASTACSTAGRIIPEMHVRLLDDDGRDITEPGVPGNPVCKGPATCFGYLDDDAGQRRAVHDRRLDAHRRRRARSTPTATSASWAARPTSSSAAGRTSARRRSKPRSPSIPRSRSPRWWRCPTRSSANACASTPSSSPTRRSSSTRSSRTSASAACRASGSPSGSSCSTRSPAPPAARSPRASSAPGTALDHQLASTTG